MLSEMRQIFGFFEAKVDIWSLLDAGKGTLARDWRPGRCKVLMATWFRVEDMTC